MFKPSTGCEFSVHGKTYSDVIDDLLALVQSVLAGIASVSSNVVNDNCLEFKIRVSANQPIVILRYELHLNKKINDTCPILFNLLKLDKSIPIVNENVAASKVVKTVDITQAVQLESCLSVPKCSRIDSIKLNNSVTAKHAHHVPDLKVAIPKYTIRSVKQQQHERNSDVKAYHKGKISEVYTISDDSDDECILPEPNKSCEGHVENSKFRRIPIEIPNKFTSISQVHPQYNINHLSSKYVNNTHVSKLVRDKELRVNKTNYSDSKQIKKHKDDFETSVCDTFRFNKEQMDTRSAIIIPDDVEDSRIEYWGYSYSGYNEPSSLWRSEEQEKMHFMQKYDDDVVAVSNEICSDEEIYQEVNALPVVCILDEDENNNSTENFIDFQNDIVKNFGNELRIKSEEILDDYERSGRSFENKHCVQVFKRLRRRRRYEKVKNTKRIYSCYYCKKTFPTMFGKLQHENIHTDVRPYSCRYCPKSFNTFSNKYGHERIHTGEKPYSCGFCGKSFGRNGDKVRHERIHTGEKPYSCSICGRAFNQLSSRNQHEKIHTGEKPHSCSYCGKSFACVSSKNRHEKIHI